MFIVFLNNAISGQICNYSSNIYGYYGYCPPTFATLPLLGSITLIGLIYLIIIILFLVFMMVLSSLVYLSQGYDIMKNKTLSLKRSFFTALKKLPVAFVSNLLVTLLYFVTYVVIGLFIFLLLNSIQNITSILVAYLVVLIVVLLTIVFIGLIIYYALLFYFINSVIIAENKGIFSAIKRSMELSKNRKTNIFGAVTLTNFISVLLIFIILLPIILLSATSYLGIFGYNSGLGAGLSISSVGTLLLFSEYVLPMVMLIISYFFILTWLGAVPIYLYNEFTFNLVKPIRKNKIVNTDQNNTKVK